MFDDMLRKNIGKMMRVCGQLVKRAFGRDIGIENGAIAFEAEDSVWDGSKERVVASFAFADFF